MAFYITTLMENTAAEDCLAAEHGLSLLIEGEQVRILYDTGASPRFLKNAGTLGATLEALDALVLSHGHFDHTGGAAALLTGPVRPRAVYLGEHFFERRYAKNQDGLMDIGAALEPTAMDVAGVPCMVVGPDPIPLANGVFLVSGFSSTEEGERPPAHLLRLRNGSLEQDAFEDEVAVVLETEQELALISGCSHAGILSMCRRVEELFGRPVTTFVGGTHLMDADDTRIRRTCDGLRERGLARLGACHCNGERATAYFQGHFPGFFRNNVGARVTIE